MASQANADLKPALMAAALAFCAWFFPLMAAKASDGPPFGGGWQSQHFQDHPLVGRIFDGKGIASTWDAMLRATERMDVVLVGETHTNADHHAIQAAVAQAMATRHTNNLFATVFEMVPQRLQPVLDRATSGELSGKALGKALAWEKRGWGSFEPYAPIFAATQAHGARLVAGNPDEDMTRALSRGGLDALDGTVANKTGLALPVSNAVQAGLIKEMADSHCDMLPEQILPNMALVQRLRDGMMARVTKDALMEGTDSSQALIVTGNGHARNDRGIPAVMKSLGTGLFTLSIGLIDVSQDDFNFADYRLTGDDGKPLYDFVVFTPRDNIGDPCEMMRQQMKARSKPKP
ncbi:MAG: ChaN family lipoprotein [Pseudomonadota bacterium]